MRDIPYIDTRQSSKSVIIKPKQNQIEEYRLSCHEDETVESDRARFISYALKSSKRKLNEEKNTENKLRKFSREIKETITKKSSINNNDEEDEEEENKE